MTNYGRIQEGVAGRDRSSGGVNEEEPTRQRQKKKPIKRCQIHANTWPDFALGRQSVVSQALEFRDTALRLLGSALLPVPQFSDLDLVGAGEGSEWLELGTLEYFRDQNQIQTLAVLGGCLVVAFNAVTKEYQVIMHNHSCTGLSLQSISLSRAHNAFRVFRAHNAVRVFRAFCSHTCRQQLQ